MRWFLEGGAGMWLIAVAGLAGIACAAVHAATRDAGPRLAALALLGVAFALGVVLTMQARARVDNAIREVDPEMRDRLRVVGYEESSHLVELAIALAAVGAIPIAVGALRKRRG
jgi:hypothetical protein